jgi:hypothetical protein
LTLKRWNAGAAGIVGGVTRECLVAIFDSSISGRRVARELTTLIEQRGGLGMIVSNNGTLAKIRRKNRPGDGSRAVDRSKEGHPCNSPTPGGFICWLGAANDSAGDKNVAANPSRIPKIKMWRSPP